MQKISIILAIVLTALPAWAQVTATNKADCTRGAGDEVRLNACTALIQSGQLSAADLTISYVNRAVVYNRMGRSDQAIADANSALATQPGFANAYGVRATAYRHQENFDLAIADDSRAIALGPDAGVQSVLYFDRGLAQEGKKLYDLALADMNKAIELRANYAIFHGGRARVYHRMGLEAEALSDAEKAASMQPANTGFLETRAEIYEKLGRRDDAVAGYRSVLQIDSAATAARAGLARLGATP
jgi:tetratricopeptide (TPR) repeat protein